MAKPVVVDLLRHGAVAAKGWAFRGRTDIPLSEKGWQQMRSVGKALNGERFDQVGTSPLQRCRDFASELSAQQDSDLITLDAMREMDFGDWENKCFEELEDQYGKLLSCFWKSPVGICPPNGEPFDDFAKRVIAGWQTWLDTAGGERRLLVAHGGVIRVLLARLLDMPMAALWRLHLPHAAWCRVSLFKDQQPRLLFLNREVEV